MGLNPLKWLSRPREEPKEVSAMIRLAIQCAKMAMDDRSPMYLGISTEDSDLSFSNSNGVDVRYHSRYEDDDFYELNYLKDGDKPIFCDLHDEDDKLKWQRHGADKEARIKQLWEKFHGLPGQLKPGQRCICIHKGGEWVPVDLNISARVMVPMVRHYLACSGIDVTKARNGKGQYVNEYAGVKVSLPFHFEVTDKLISITLNDTPTHS